MNNNVMLLKTIQTNPFRNLIEATKEILTDTNFVFTSDGVKLITLDTTTQTILVHLKLYAKNFETYYCEEPIQIGLNLPNFYKLIKTIQNNDTLVLYIDRNNRNELGIRIENGEKNYLTNYKLNLIEVDSDDITIPEHEFQSIIMLPSSDFNRICRDMDIISDTIEIKSIGSQLIFSCKGEIGNQETIMGETEKGLKFEHTPQDNNIVQGYYNLKHLKLFHKCTNLSGVLIMYLKNSYPMVLEFSVGNLGILKLALAPKMVA
jgi:proliferating cell nuclear antigen